MDKFPQKLFFLSDDTEAEFVNEIVGAKIKERMANYKYTKARVNKGMVFTMFLSQISNLLNDKLIICKQTTS